MLESVPTAPRRAVIRLGVAALAALIVAAPLTAQSGAATAYATIRGSVADSVHGGPLAGAAVDLLPQGRRATTNDLGEFRFDSVPAAEGYQIRVGHAMLDTIGISLATPKFKLDPGEAKQWSLAVPSPARLVAMLCLPEQIARGPSALVGFVRDPDTGDAIDSAKVALVYDDNTLGLVKRPVYRETSLDASGRYKICGLPAQVNGRVQLLRNGTQSAEIPVTTSAISPLALRSMGMSLATQHVVTGQDSAGNKVRILRGTARLTGRVMTKSGMPLAGAHVQMDATTAAAVTGSDGRFTLDSLPTGTQTVSVRKLGFTVTEQAVEVSSGPPSMVSVLMEDYIPTLATVVTVAQRDKDLERVGFTRRKRQGMGIYRDGDEVPRSAAILSDALATMPGIHVIHSNTAYGSQSRISGANGLASCMAYVVDGVVWRDGDQNDTIDDFVRPDEVEAIELYSPATVPSDFAISAQSNCQVLVIWTNRKIRRGSTKTTKPPL